MTAAGEGVLVLHGFTGTPYEVAPLCEALRRAGYAVEAPMLPGHGTSPRELQTTTWRDWYQGAARALDALAGRAASLAVVGLSMGGLIALLLAARRDDVRAVATLAAPLWLPWPQRAGVAVARRLVGYLPKGASDIRDPDQRRRSADHHYDVFPLRAVQSLIELTREARRALPAVRAPVLAIHSRGDHTAPPGSLDLLARRLRDVRTVRLHRSFHVITLDVERDRVIAEVEGFLTARLR